MRAGRVVMTDPEASVLVITTAEERVMSDAMDWEAALEDAAADDAAWDEEGGVVAAALDISSTRLWTKDGHTRRKQELMPRRQERYSTAAAASSAPVARRMQAGWKIPARPMRMLGRPKRKEAGAR
jgi:hypothetical protein